MTVRSLEQQKETKANENRKYRGLTRLLLSTNKTLLSHHNLKTTH